MGLFLFCSGFFRGGRRRRKCSSHNRGGKKKIHSFPFGVINSEHTRIWQCILKTIIELFFPFLNTYECFAGFFQVDKYTKPFSFSLCCIYLCHKNWWLNLWNQYAPTHELWCHERRLVTVTSEVLTIVYYFSLLLIEQVTNKMSIVTFFWYHISQLLFLQPFLYLFPASAVFATLQSSCGWSFCQVPKFFRFPFYLHAALNKGKEVYNVM